ncbi:MAG: hypothetical protein ACU85V_07750 [Gammaproteobacteria bacterium]
MDNPRRMESSFWVGVWEFLATLVKGILRDLVKFGVAFCIGTGAAALACLYYELPLVLSLLGGFIVLGIALALVSDSWFY